MTTPLDRIDAIIMANDDDNHIELMEINARLLPPLRDWAEKHAAWSRALGESEMRGEALPVAIIGHHSDELRVVDNALAAALRGDP